ncbi:MAG: motility associated factor glycosyltransferase family protein [Clostridium sp.]|nr:motility associated factor glycosyltransferase family protein [Clostridium sp.]
MSYDNVFLYVEGINSKNLFMDLCNNISWSMLSSQILCYHTGYKKLYHEKYTDFNLIIDKYKYALKISQNTSLKYAKKFSVNILKNIHFIKKSNYIGELIGKIPKNIPVIIISAGPSLEKNICELKKARNKALILATDTAVDYLQKKDIKFDAIVTIDGDKKLERIGDEACKYLPMFTIPDAKNEFLEENEGRKIWISGAGYLECLYEKFNIKFPEYIAGGSVATAAFQIAKMIGSKTIILVGQDLAYSGKITHIGNVIDGYKSDGEDLFVEGILEDKVRTRYDWLRYLQWFESAIEQLGDDQFVIDATEGGAKIHGAVEMKLSQAIDRYCKVHFDFDDFLSELNVTFTGDKYLEICKDIANISNELEDILRYSKIGVEITQDIIETLQIKKINDIEINRNLNEIDKLKEKITDKKIYILLDEYISEDVAVIFKKNKQIYNSEVEELLDNIKSNKILFEALINASNKLKKVAEKSVTKMYDID